MRDQAFKAQQTYEHDLDKLWGIIKKSTPEKAKAIMEQLDEKTITALRTKNNPYRKPVFKNTGGRDDRILAFNVINLTEKYLQRLAMTSLVGFTYRMLDEYEPEESKKFPSENDAEFGNLHVQRVEELKLQKPVEIYSTRAREINARIAELRAAPDGASDELRVLTKESFIVRAKLYKYQLQLANANRKKTKDTLKLLRAEIDGLERSVEVMKKHIPKLEQAIKNKTAYDEAVNKHKEDGKTLTTAIREKLAQSVDLTLEDAEARTVGSYRMEITDKEQAISRAAEKADAKNAESQQVEKEFEIMNAEIEAIEQKLAVLKTDYSKKFRSTTVPKALPKGSKKTRASQPVHALDSVEPEPYEPTDDDIDEINTSVKAQLGIERTREEHTEYIQDIIQDFLDEYFVYNPDTHVQCAYKPNYEDPLRTPLELDEHRHIVEEEYERRLVPPDDTFFRWNRYLENNYEEIRQATDDIYSEKSDFEFDIVPLEIFEGPNAKDEMEAFNRKYADEVEADILAATFGSHNLMGSWAQNREKRDFYNENTEIIKRILDENEESQKFGRKLNKQRAEKKKQENEKIAGPHAKSFSDYKNSNPSSLRDHGATEASQIATDNIIPRDNGKLGKDEVEVGVTEIRPVRRRGGRRGFRGTGEQWKFHVPEEELKPENVKIGRPSAMHKKIAKEERAAEDAALEDAF